MAPSFAAPTAWLIDQWGATHAIPTNATIGRDPAEVSIAILHHTVSSMHAQLLAHDNGWQLVDRGSLNGTFVSGLRIRESAIENGDLIGFGDISLFFSEAKHDEKVPASGPGRTVPSKQGELSFSAVLASNTRSLEVSQRPGGGIAQSNTGWKVEFARLEFSLLVLLIERRQQARNEHLAYVSSRELAEKLDFRSQDADTDNVRELIRRVRKKFQAQEIDDLIDSRQGVGYRIAWPLKS